MSTLHAFHDGTLFYAFKSLRATLAGSTGRVASLLCNGLLVALTLAAAPTSASVTYQFTGSPLNYTPPSSFFPPGQPPLPPPPSPFGTFVFGSAVFDDTLVTADFNGILSTGFVATMGTNLLAQRTADVDFMRGLPPAFTFDQGQIVGWNLLTMQVVFPGIANYSVPLHVSNLGDQLLPLTGGLILGQASAGTGHWTRVEAPPAVPLPAAWPLLLAGLSAFAALRRKPR